MLTPEELQADRARRQVAQADETPEQVQPARARDRARDRARARERDA
jgi:hypothetical protein